MDNCTQWTRLSGDVEVLGPLWLASAVVSSTSGSCTVAVMPVASPVILS